MLVGYMRVSSDTDRQTTDLQRDALLAAGVDERHLFQDRASGARDQRPGLTTALAFLRPGDCLVVWKLDRLGRSLPHLLTIVMELKARGVAFRSLTEQMDTTTPQGEFLVSVFGALAQYVCIGLQYLASFGGDRRPITSHLRSGRIPPWVRTTGWQARMLTVDTIGRIRREHAKGRSIRAIARSLKVSRETVTTYVRSGETAPKYERQRQPYPKLEGFQEELERLIAENARQPVGDRLDYLGIFGRLKDAGFRGGYDTVRRYIKRWKQRQPATAAVDAYVPLTFAPGEAYQFDWAEEWIILDGVTTKVQVAHVRLCHSRMPFVMIYLRQTQEMVFDAHAQAVAFYGGLCDRGIYDNMKTAVDAVFVGKERKFNRRFSQMCSHDLVDPVACSPASGWEKGQVENQVGSLRQRLFTPRLRVKTVDEANERLRAEAIAWAQQARHPEDKDRTVWEVFQSERPALIPVPVPFDGFHETTVSASKTCLIRFDRNRYSVAASAAGKPVQVRAYATRIVVWLNGEIVAEHPRAFGSGHTVYNPLHYLPVRARKPGALRNGAPFRDWELPPGLARVRARLGRSNEADRPFAGILAAVLTDGLEAVEAACHEALEGGTCSRDVVLNILARRNDPKPAAAVAVPEALTLAIEPAADCERYDRLRATREGCHGTA